MKALAGHRGLVVLGCPGQSCDRGLPLQSHEHKEGGGIASGEGAGESGIWKAGTAQASVSRKGSEKGESRQGRVAEVVLETRENVSWWRI